MAGYSGSKDDYLKRLKRRGPDPRHLADGRGGHLLHRHPHPCLRGDQGPAGRARACSRTTSGTASSTPPASPTRPPRPRSPRRAPPSRGSSDPDPSRGLDAPPSPPQTPATPRDDGPMSTATDPLLETEADAHSVDPAITGMTCASCSARIERNLGKIEGSRPASTSRRRRQRSATPAPSTSTSSSRPSSPRATARQSSSPSRARPRRRTRRSPGSTCSAVRSSRARSPSSWSSRHGSVGLRRQPMAAMAAHHTRRRVGGVALPPRRLSQCPPRPRRWTPSSASA